MIILDVNDNRFYFICINVIYILEYVIIGDVVMRVMVVDLDEGSNSEISFSFVKLDVFVLFSLGIDDGILWVLGNFDCEGKFIYDFKVIVLDWGILLK